MKRGVGLILLSAMIAGMVALLLGCPPPPMVVRVRPPEARIEVYGAPPFPAAVWLPGHWKHRDGEWIWVPGHWAKPPRHGSVWVPGHWEPRGDGWVWRQGRWERR